MIVPDKKTQAYLNEPASVRGVLRLCRAGVLPFGSFLQAAALCRSDAKWAKFILLILRFLTGLSFLSAVFFFTISKWDLFYQKTGFVFLAFLLVICAFSAYRFRLADYGGAFLIGAMVFWPDIVFKTNSFLYQQFFLWFILLTLWAVPSPRTGIKLLAFFVLNSAFCLYGFQFLLPSFTLGADPFFWLAALFNLAFLSVGEKGAGRLFFLKTPAFRLTPLAFAFVYLLAVPAKQCFGLSLPGVSSSDGGFILCFLATLVCGFAYAVKKPDKTALNLTIGFAVIWTGLLVYRIVFTLSLPPDSQKMLSFVLFSLIGVVAILCTGRETSFEGGKNDN